MYGYVAPVFWMFIEGVYLHSRIATNVFDSKAPFKFYYFVGWFLPLVCVLSWTATMITQSPDEYCVTHDDTTGECQGNHTCWEGYTEQPFAYILSIPMIIALAINLLFLINIVRIVVTKMQLQATFQTQPEGMHIRKAIRATLILFPLLGLTNLLFFINPKNGKHDKLYMLFNATMQSSQGIFLAILYCFLNSEVQDCFKRLIKRLTTRHDMRMEGRRNGSMMCHRSPAVSVRIKKSDRPAPSDRHAPSHASRRFLLPVEETSVAERSPLTEMRIIERPEEDGGEMRSTV